MERKTRFNLIYFNIFFVVLLLLQQYVLSREMVIISYSEIKMLLKERLLPDGPAAAPLAGFPCMSRTKKCSCL